MPLTAGHHTRGLVLLAWSLQLNLLATRGTPRPPSPGGIGSRPNAQFHARKDINLSPGAFS